MIYRHLLCNEAAVQLCRNAQLTFERVEAVVEGRVIRPPQGRELAILRICRQVHGEAKETLYGSIRIFVQAYRQVHHVLNASRPKLRGPYAVLKLIKYLKINIPSYYITVDKTLPDRQGDKDDLPLWPQRRLHGRKTFPLFGEMTSLVELKVAIGVWGPTAWAKTPPDGQWQMDACEGDSEVVRFIVKHVPTSVSLAWTNAFTNAPKAEYILPVERLQTLEQQHAHLRGQTSATWSR